MKRLLLIILLAATFNPSQAQIRPRITRIRNVGVVTMKENLLDNTPGFKRAAIAFVPLVPDVRKGYEPEKIYQIKNNEGVVIGSAKGKDILDKVNEVERSLNERGHSLREKHLL